MAPIAPLAADAPAPDLASTASDAPPIAATPTTASDRSAQRHAALAHEQRETFLLLFAPILLMTLVVGALQKPLERVVVYADGGGQAHPVLRSAGPRAAIVGEAPVVALNDAGSKPAPTIGPTETVAALPPQAELAAVPADRGGGRCEYIKVPKLAASVAAVSTATFGRLLAKAAASQTTDLVVYQERYRDIAFPMGDVPALYGVCTDVVVRAYRALGIDLQELVQKARIGIGDRSIDHRRTETLRRFFARYGSSIPPTDFVEEYQPGDIVTYTRPSGRTSQSHIAIVSDHVAASGRPMIVHNRAWGPTIEDALFANEITGHYRFDSIQAANVTAQPRGDATRKKQASAADENKKAEAETKKKPDTTPQKRADANR